MPSEEINARRLRLVAEVLRLPEDRVVELEQWLRAAPAGNPAGPGPVPSAPASRSWPHAPLHRLCEHGTYLVTAATLERQSFFRGADRLDQLESKLLALANSAGWQLEAWAVFANHYHFVGHAQPACQPLSAWLAALHRQTAAAVNELDHAPGRQVWFNYWDTRLTFEKSYLARLNYVHQNPVKHGLVRVANQYRWCSAAWFERTATPAQVATISSFKIDRLRVPDDFDPV